MIFRMVAENPTWGAPRIHGELLKLGFDISERTVSRWVTASADLLIQCGAGWHFFGTIAKQSLRMDFRVEEIPAGCRLPLAVSTVSGFVPV